MALFYYTFTLALLVASITAVYPENQVFDKNTCFIVNLGDSNSDTGSGCAAFGFPTQPPPPVTLFEGQKANCRQSNGRLYIDFLCEKLGIKYLSPYLESVGSDYSHGVNFAVSNAPAYWDEKTTFPFHLGVQVMQFAHFVNRTKMFTPRGAKFEDELRNAIFTIDAGQNDLSAIVFQDRQLIVRQLIPKILGKMGIVIKSLYDVGGRKFIVYNTGPLGCLPIYVKGNISGVPLDRVGCLSNINSVVRAFNERLKSMCAKLMTELKEAMVIYTDIYSVKYDLIAHPSDYGFVNPLVQCFVPEKSTICVDPSRAISWDGSHYTDAANRIVAEKIWSGVFFHPFNTTFPKLCEKVDV